MKKKPNLEELIKLKRTERPSKQDWDMFDKKLKNKLLENLIQKEPSIFEKFPIFSLKNASFASATIVLLTAIFAPTFFSSIDINNIPDNQYSSIENVTLPDISQNFTYGEISVGVSLESPVNAMFNSDNEENTHFITSSTQSLFSF